MGIIFVLLFIFGIFYVIGKINLNRTGYWLVGGYAAILLVSVVLYLFIPKEQFLAEEEYSNNEDTVDIVSHVAYEGVSIDDYEEYKTEEWIFEPPANGPLYLNMDSDHYHIPVIVDEVRDATKISATLYHVKLPYEFERFDDGYETLALSYENGELWIITPPIRTFEYAMLAKEFPFTQLSSSEEEEYYGPLEFYGEELVIFLEVPEGLGLDIDDMIYTEYIE